jgi:hypothetical protein
MNNDVHPVLELSIASKDSPALWNMAFAGANLIGDQAQVTLVEKAKRDVDASGYREKGSWKPSGCHRARGLTLASSLNSKCDVEVLK